MTWHAEPVGDVILVRMTSSPVNKINPQFLAELHETFDRLDRDWPRLPVILTGSGEVFSAGIDLEHSFPLFQSKSHAAIVAWLDSFARAILRVFASERPTVAAVNGHAVAGGLILALCCDVRVAAAGAYRSGLNEVRVGVPMPSVYTEIIRSRIGTRRATTAILSGALYSPEEAVQIGFYDELAAPGQLIDRAKIQALTVPRPALKAYIHSKQMLLSPVLDRIHTTSRVLDIETARVICDDDLCAAQAQALEGLKRRSKPNG